MVRAARGFDVLFWEEPEFGDGPAALHRREVDGVTVLTPELPHGLSSDRCVAATHQLLRQVLADQAEPRVCWYNTPAALAFSRDVPRALTVYDNMDELSAFKGASPDLLRLEAELLAGADLVFTGGRSLFEAKRGRHRAVHCFPSSVDVAHFGRARALGGTDPADQSALPHPRLGFFGVIDERMDLDYLARFADLRPDWHFVMIGPVVKIDPATLPRRANIHWLGFKTYAELPHYIAHWDVAFMPFALNESTRFISPTKTPEFLAGGLPVISTPVVDVVRAYGDGGLVAIAATADEAVRAAERMLDACPPDWLERVDAALGRQSWDTTWHAMHGLIDQHLQRALPDAQGAATAAAHA